MFGRLLPGPRRSLSAPRVLVERCLQLLFRPGIHLLEEDDADAPSLLRFSRSTRRLWPILPAAQPATDADWSRHCPGSHSGNDRGQTLQTCDEASGCRSMLFGVKMMSGLRHERIACRRKRWKYLRGSLRAGRSACCRSRRAAGNVRCERSSAPVPGLRSHGEGA